MSEYSEAEQYERFKNWVRANGMVIVVGIALGAAGWSAWVWNKDRRVTQVETASARYEEMLEAFGRNDRTRGLTIADDLNREYAWTPYAALAGLMSALRYMRTSSPPARFSLATPCSSSSTSTRNPRVSS